MLDSTERSAEQHATAVLAGGCFWCVVADLQKVPGVISVVPGYSGGTAENPTYEKYAASGHREVVEVRYEPSVLSYEALITYFLKHIDPTDGSGSFFDRGVQYAPVIYYATTEERATAERVLAAVDALGIFDKPLAVTVEPRGQFWPAEEYHRDYHKKSPTHYAAYRNASGRDAFAARHWGTELTKDGHVASTTEGENETAHTFEKPADEALRERLTPEQYDVTQRCGTEAPFSNEHYARTDEGVYVDVVSGEPLFLSQDKYDSGTGWPSFVRPINSKAVTTREDHALSAPRTEVRSSKADSHLGHVFNDGPKEQGGKRYCMNSAALRFIPKEKLREEGYEDLLRHFDED